MPLCARAFFRLSKRVKVKTVLFPESVTITPNVGVCRFLRMSTTAALGVKMPFIDIGANLTDDMYQGIYNGSQKHEPDLDKVLERSWKIGLQKIIVTAGNYDECVKALELVKSDERLFTTLGVHPTRCSEFDSKFSSPIEYCEKLKYLLDSNGDKIVAIGEFGLDSDRTKFCDEATQQKYFDLQLAQIASTANLPLFLHCRNAASSLQKILNDNPKALSCGGVVHSFDGTLEEMKTFLELGLHIGINGCSLKTEENCKVAAEVPTDRLLLETDAPWCGVRPSHFSSKYVKTKFEASKKAWNETSMYKTRNEPQTIMNVLEIMAALKDMDPSELALKTFENSNKVFFT